MHKELFMLAKEYFSIATGDYIKGRLFEHQDIGHKGYTYSFYFEYSDKAIMCVRDANTKNDRSSIIELKSIEELYALLKGHQ